MSVPIFTPTSVINKWLMPLCNNPSEYKSYWMRRVYVIVSAQVTTVTYMHQLQPSLHLLLKILTLHLELWPGNHLIWFNATLSPPVLINLPGQICDVTDDRPLTVLQRLLSVTAVLCSPWRPVTSQHGGSMAQREIQMVSLHQIKSHWRP